MPLLLFFSPSLSAAILPVSLSSSFTETHWRTWAVRTYLDESGGAGGVGGVKKAIFFFSGKKSIRECQTWATMGGQDCRAEQQQQRRSSSSSSRDAAAPPNFMSRAVRRWLVVIKVCPWRAVGQQPDWLTDGTWRTEQWRWGVRLLPLQLHTSSSSSSSGSSSILQFSPAPLSRIINSSLAGCQEQVWKTQLSVGLSLLKTSLFRAEACPWNAARLRDEDLFRLVTPLPTLSARLNWLEIRCKCVSDNNKDNDTTNSML